MVKLETRSANATSVSLQHENTYGVNINTSFQRLGLYTAIFSRGLHPLLLPPCQTMMTLCKILIKNSELICGSYFLRLSLIDYRYDFEYEDDDEEEAGDVGVENKYYNAKQMKADNPDEAIQEFLGMPALEDEKGDWSVSIKMV